MAIRGKTDGANAESDEAKPKYSNNPEINKKIDERIVAFPKDFKYYADVVKEDPDRAVRLLILKDHEAAQKASYAILKNLEVAKAWYAAQSGEAKETIDRKLAGVKPYFADRELAKYVLGEIGQRGISEFAEKQGIKAKAG